MQPDFPPFSWVTSNLIFNHHRRLHATRYPAVFATGCGISLARIKVNEKSNEITAIPELLDMLDIEGCTISIDAMGCQKDIASKIISKKADYILAIKDNQPTLRPDALLASKHCPADDDFTDIDAGHG